MMQKHSIHIDKIFEEVGPTKYFYNYTNLYTSHLTSNNIFPNSVYFRDLISAFNICTTQHTSTSITKKSTCHKSQLAFYLDL